MGTLGFDQLLADKLLNQHLHPASLPVPRILIFAFKCENSHSASVLPVDQRLYSSCLERFGELTDRQTDTYTYTYIHTSRNGKNEELQGPKLVLCFSSKKSQHIVTGSVNRLSLGLCFVNRVKTLTSVSLC